MFPPRNHIALIGIGPVSLQNDLPYNLPILGGSGNDIPQSTAVDPVGNIWIAGTTDSDDFHLVNPIVATKIPYRTAGFVIELDPTATKLLFATFLGGQTPTAYNSPTPSSSASTLTTDKNGNVFVGGSTSESDFPTTPGAFAAGGPRTTGFGDVNSYSYLMKISAAGKLAFSALLGTSKVGCSGGSRCIGHESTSATVSSLAIDPAGNPIVTGISDSAYVFQVAPNGSAIFSSTTVGSDYGLATAVKMAQDARGNLYFLGRYLPINTTFPELTYGTPGLFVAKLTQSFSSGQTIDLGKSADASVTGVSVDASGNAYFAGTHSALNAPALSGAPSLGGDFLLQWSAIEAKPAILARLPKGTVVAPPAFDGSSQLLVLGAHSSLLTLAPTPSASPGIVSFANSASFEVNTGAFPGALITLFGVNLPDSSRDVQVLVDGVSAPVLYSGPNQINFQVPFEASQMRVQVTLLSGTFSFDIPNSRSIGLFTTDGVHAAAINQDGTVNSASNPAGSQTIVSLFGTGASWMPGMQTGAVAPSPKRLENNFEVVAGTATLAPVLYAGAAPGQSNGVFQVNIQLPSTRFDTLKLQATGLSGFLTDILTSNAVQIYVK